MDRDVLAGMIEEGLSQSEIGRRVGLHASTVAYWCGRHGLVPVGRARHRARGSIDRATLEALIGRDLTIRAIASEVNRSPTTVRYWLREYGLTTTERARNTRGRSARRVADCAKHGHVHFVVHADGTSTCSRCRLDAVTQWRRRAKRMLVDEAGGSCRLCGYARCLAALHFHHTDPSTKRFALSGRGLARSIDVLREEASKCVLLCSNCHAEVEAGAATLP